MAATTLARTKSSEYDNQSLSRSTRYYSSSSSSSRICSSSGFASSTMRFSSRPSPSSSDLPTRSSSPSYSSPAKVSVSVGGQSQFSTTPVRLSVDPRRSVSSVTKMSHQVNQIESNVAKTSCMCSPSTHPGAFRCRMHKNAVAKSNNAQSQNTASPAYARLFLRRSAVTNSIARLGVEGERVKRALASLVRPAEARRPSKRGEFRPRPSRLSKMSGAEDS